MAKLSAESGMNCCRAANNFIWICVFILVFLFDLSIGTPCCHLRHLSFKSQADVRTLCAVMKKTGGPLCAGIRFLFAENYFSDII
jgi:hypothetical protein